MNALRALFGLAVFTAILVWATRPANHSSDERGDFQSGATGEASPPSSRITTSASSAIRVNPGKDALWERFRERFGRELEPKFTPDGRLFSIRGRPGRAKRSEAFTPEDPRKALARAKEILHAANDLIGVTPDWPLEHPVAKGGRTSAQVFFQETQAGVDVGPFGSVSVDLDSQGGLLGLDSSYVPNPTIVNQPGLSSSEARLRALAAVPEGSTALKVEGGDPILWVARDASGAPQAHHAFEYYVQGRQVIVDAASGAILHKKDVRQY